VADWQASCRSLRSAVWEVRTNLGTRIARTLFAVEGAQMILLHGFIKKTQRTPSDDIELAQKRFKEWQHGEK
jgi:phage-related protein